jgi:hypothetical protein
MRKTTTLPGLRLCFVLPFCLMLAACAKDQRRPILTFPLSRVVKIPTGLFTADTSRSALRQNPALLAMTGGAEDELPQGPEGFEVLDDGSFAITDPLQQRLAFYDSLGVFREAWPIGFAANSVALLDDGTLEVRKANSNDSYHLDSSRQPRLVAAAGGRGEETAAAEVRLLDGKHAVISASRTRGEAASSLKVDFESDSTRMISLQKLDSDPQGFVYVAIETAASTEFVEVNKIVRKYAADGSLIGQIIDIPLDYEVYPTHEFRVRNGRVYHLLPKQGEVTIRMWNTNQKG